MGSQPRSPKSQLRAGYHSGGGCELRGRLPFHQRMTLKTVNRAEPACCAETVLCRSVHSSSLLSLLLGSSIQNQSLEWFLLSSSQPADPYLASLRDSVTLLTRNSQLGSLTRVSQVAGTKVTVNEGGSLLNLWDTNGPDI